MNTTTAANSATLVMMSLARLARLGQESDQRGASPKTAPQVVCLRKGEPGAALSPLVLIHPIGGSIMPYRDLCGGLARNRAVYAVRSQADEERNTLRHASVSSLAEDYAAQLASLDLGPRIVLGGYSLGGAVAFEMACRIPAHGMTADTVIIIDTPAKIRKVEQANHDVVTPQQLLMFGNFLAGRLGENLNLSFADLEQIAVSDGIQRLLDRLRELKVIQGTTGDQLYHDIYEMARHNEALQRHFAPGQYDGSLSLVRTLDEAPDFKVEAPEVYHHPHFGWQNHCTGNVAIKHVPGGHFQLLYPPFIQHLAVAVQQFLNEHSPAHQ